MFHMKFNEITERHGGSSATGLRLVKFARRRMRQRVIIAADGVGEGCMRRHARATTWALSLFAILAASPSHAADLIWEVESPFRFFDLIFSSIVAAAWSARIVKRLAV
jgi:hypothetical protein